jgi:PAS domain S-box-containing protein
MATWVAMVTARHVRRMRMSQPSESQPQPDPGNTASELKKVEAKLRLMTKVLKDSADPTIIRDLDGCVLDVNHEVERVFGWRREEMIGNRTKHLFAPECRKAAEKLHQRRLQGETVRNFETIVRAESGRLVPVLATVFLLTDEEGKPVAMADILKDVTQLKQACNRVHQQNRDLKQFARALSHDLATPLGAIRGFADILSQDHREQLDEAGREHCQSILDAADRMNRMIKDLLNLTSLENDLIELVPTELSTVLDDALCNLSAIIRDNEAVITSDPLPTVPGSATLLTRLFQNLIGNALKFRREDTPQIHVTAERSADAWQISVRDNGIGIDSQHYEKIFSPLHRLHAESVFPGTGIGLTACRSIVERFGGRIWVESERGRGSTFHFTVPDQPPERDAD